MGGYAANVLQYFPPYTTAEVFLCRPSTTGAVRYIEVSSSGVRVGSMSRLKVFLWRELQTIFLTQMWKVMPLTKGRHLSSDAKWLQWVGE